MMRLRSLVVACTLAVLSFATAQAKSYEIELLKPLKAGKIELKPGVYNLNVQGDSAVFTDRQKASYTAPVKIESSTTKFNYTVVDSHAGQIRYIELGGTKTRLVFGE
jgi:hypothetical protein